MADCIKLKIDKTQKSVEVEIGEEQVVLSFEFIRDLVTNVVSTRKSNVELEIPLK